MQVAGGQIASTWRCSPNKRAGGALNIHTIATAPQGLLAGDIRPNEVSLHDVVRSGYQANIVSVCRNYIARSRSVAADGIAGTRDGHTVGDVAQGIGAVNIGADEIAGDEICLSRSLPG